MCTCSKLSSSGGLVYILRDSVSGDRGGANEAYVNEGGCRMDSSVGRHGGVLAVDCVAGMSDRIENR